MEQDTINQSPMQLKISFANSTYSAILPELLEECRTQMPSVIGKDEFNTLVNALTAEVEVKFIMKVLTKISNIRKGQYE